MKLKSIESRDDFINLQELVLSGFPELNELPSFANSSSLRRIVTDCCDKVEKLEGLEHAISLQQLIAMTMWKSQGVQSLVRMERLNTVKLIAEKRSALQPCIQTIKKWPCEMLIGGRAVSGVGSVMNSLSFPKLTVIRREKWLWGDSGVVENVYFQRGLGYPMFRSIL